MMATALVGLTLLLTACGPAGEAETSGPAAESARPVVVARPAPAPTLAGVRATGRIEAGDELALSFKVGGVVESVRVDTGDTVRAGQVLARLDRTEAAAGAERAAQALAQAERDLERAEELASRQLIARRVRDDAETARDVAAAATRAARFDLTFATITAPADGRVKARLARPGEILAPGQPALTLAAEGRGWLLKAALADRDALRLQVGDPAEVRSDALPGARFEARVARIAGAADPRTGTIEVEFTVADPDARLRSGLIAEVDAPPDDSAEGLAIPVTALVRADGPEAEVRLVEGGRAAARQVLIGPIAGDQVLVSSGLDAEDLVIVAGGSLVDPGEPVRVVSR
jgi:RND family efflux transporter MFP subunit